jgi:hypothetical protein
LLSDTDRKRALLEQKFVALMRPLAVAVQRLRDETFGPSAASLTPHERLFARKFYGRIGVLYAYFSTPRWEVRVSVWLCNRCPAPVAAAAGFHGACSTPDAVLHVLACSLTLTHSLSHASTHVHIFMYSPRILQTQVSSFTVTLSALAHAPTRPCLHHARWTRTKLR